MRALVVAVLIASAPAALAEEREAELGAGAWFVGRAAFAAPQRQNLG